MAGWAGRTGVCPLRKTERFATVKDVAESMREAKKGYCQLHFAVLQQPLHKTKAFPLFYQDIYDCVGNTRININL